MLAILVSSSRLLLDEPSMGLTPTIVSQIFERIPQGGVPPWADRRYVLSTGRIVTSGAGRELLRNKQVKGSYLGA